MKTNRYILLFTVLFMGLASALKAQTNKLYIPDVSIQPGKSIALPVYVDNSSEIVAAQFTLQLPEALALSTEGASMDENRSDGHTVTVRKLGSNKYMFMVMSPKNAAIKGRTGTLLTIPLSGTSSIEENATYDLIMTGAVLSAKSGKNVLTEQSVGKVQVLKCPDLIVKDVECVQSTVAPGDEISVSWKVSNQGTAPTGAGWRELIYFVNGEEKSQLLHTSYYDSTLATDAEVNRTATFTVPELVGTDGTAHIEVQVIPSLETGESADLQTNNTSSSANTINVVKRLYVSAPSFAFTEGDQVVSIMLKRSGSWADDEIFTLTVTGDKRLSVPERIVIEKGKSATYFDLTIKDNEILDASSQFSLSIVGNGYEKLTQEITVEDDEHPTFILTAADASGKEISGIGEGESFVLHIKTEQAPSEDLTLALSSDLPKRFSYPSQVVLNAGQNEVTVTIQAIDDDISEIEQVVTFSVSALGYDKADLNMAVTDNDEPILELELLPNIVSEAAGLNAVQGVVRRKSNINKYATIHLTDDSNGGIQYQDAIVVLEKGAEEVRFSLGVVDNDIVDGQRTYTVTAALYSASCSCSVTEHSKGYVSAELTVIDNDGPTVNLVSSSLNVKEGETAEITVSRNVVTDQPLEVTLSADNESNLEYEHNVVIPAGEQSVTVPVTFLNNGVTGDGRLVTFKASADEYSMGVCAIYVTDQSLPDAVVTSLKLDNFVINVGESVNVTYTVKNAGVAPLPENTDISLYLAGEKVYTGKLVSPLAVGEETTLTASLENINELGVLDVYVTVNADKTVSELSYSNNTSEYRQLIVSSPFNVSSLSASKESCEPGESITISGKLEGTEDAISEVDVEVYYMLNGYRTAVKTKTNENGEFSADIKLIDGIYGTYKFGACYPNEDVKEEMASVDVFGMTIESGSNNCEIVSVGESKTGTITIHNPASTPLSGANVKLNDVPSNITFKANVPTTIPAESNVNVSYTVTGSAVSEGNDWSDVLMTVESSEGVQLPLTVKTFVTPGEAELITSAADFTLNVTQGTTTSYCINVKNTGKGSTGKMHLDLPTSDWISSPRSVYPAIGFNEEQSFTIDFTPTTDMPLNSQYSTQFLIHGEDGGALTVNALIKVVSESTGRVFVDAVDEGTFYYDDQPHVANATVQFIDPYSNKVVATGTTDSEGHFLSDEIPCGTYYCKVSKDKHGDFTELVYVEAAATSSVEAFLAIAPITYSWQVTPTTVEDEYEFKLITTYETQVPTPVVVIDFANELPKDMAVGESATIMATLTNYGLVEAEDVNVRLGEHAMFDFDIQVKHFDTLKPSATEFVPIKVTRKEDTSVRHRAKTIKFDCTAYKTEEVFAGFRRRCNYATRQWDTIQVTNSFEVPVPHVECSMQVGLPSYTGFPVPYPSTTYIVTTPPGRNGPGVPRQYNGTVIKIPYIELEEDSLENCIEDCWDGFDDQMNDWKEALDNLAKAAKKAGKKLTPAVVRGNLGPMWDALKLGWDIGKWLDECLVPLVPGLWEAMHGDGSKYAVKSRRNAPDKTASEINISEQQIQQLGEAYKAYMLISKFMDESTTDEEVEQLNKSAQEAGFEDLFEQAVAGAEGVVAIVTQTNPGGCTKVKVEFTQTAMFTREAFQGRLSVNNTSANPIEDFELKFRIEDLQGNDCTSLFQINPNYSISGVETGADGKGTIAGESTGVYEMLFIPTKNAAPVEPVLYRFTGTMSFTNPNSGLPFSATLRPVTLTVSPTPEIDVMYFLQRDILGDDALTEEVEPSVPSELSVLLNNKGNGDADNVRFIVKQPEIIENEKDLIIGFQITSARLNGDESSEIYVTKDQSTVNFGTIPAHSTSYAQWDLTSTLLGHFAEYDISYSHLTSYGNDDLSILGDVSIHELIRSLDASLTDKTVKGFLVNDIQDSKDEPDAIYLSNGAKEDVHIATDAQFTKSSTGVYQLKVTPSAEGWNYINIPVSTGKQTIQKVVRVRDGQVMNNRNFWITNVTINDLLKPTYEDRLHCAVEFDSENEELYEITFEPRADVPLEIVEITGIPDTDYALTEPVQSVVVKFNKPIVPSSFTSGDIKLMVQGKQQNVDGAKVVQIDSQTYSIEFNATSAEDGLYVLTIQTAGIKDTEGYVGETGKTVSWIIYNSNLEDFEFVDGTVYDAVKTDIHKSISYTRSFGNTEWQALYVPFSIDYDEWKDKVEIAEITNSWASNENSSTTKDIAMDYRLVDSGRTLPNTPYLIRAFEQGTVTFLLLENPVTYPANINHIDMSTDYTRFFLQGTYSGVDGATMLSKQYLAMSGGYMKYASDEGARLKPQRWYIEAYNYDGSPFDATRIKLRRVDATSVDIISNDAEADKKIYTVDGRLVRTDGDASKLSRGVYVRGNKKFTVK